MFLPYPLLTRLLIFDRKLKRQDFRTDFEGNGASGYVSILSRQSPLRRRVISRSTACPFTSITPYPFHYPSTPSASSSSTHGNTLHATAPPPCTSAQWGVPASTAAALRKLWSHGFIEKPWNVSSGLGDWKWIEDSWNYENLLCSITPRLLEEMKHQPLPAVKSGIYVFF